MEERYDEQIQAGKDRLAETKRHNKATEAHQQKRNTQVFYHDGQTYKIDNQMWKANWPQLYQLIMKELYPQGTDSNGMRIYHETDRDKETFVKQYWYNSANAKALMNTMAGNDEVIDWTPDN